MVQAGLIVFQCDKLFSPYTADGETLESTLKWLRAEIDIDDRIVSEVVNDTMLLLSQGGKFPLPCPCGCGKSEIHIPIRHFMLEVAFSLKNKVEKAISEVLNNNEEVRLEKMVASGKMKKLEENTGSTFKRFLKRLE